MAENASIIQRAQNELSTFGRVGKQTSSEILILAISHAATITALRDRVAEVERERDDARSGNRYAQLERLAIKRAEAALARATAAEAAIARLRDEVERMREALVRYGDRARMSNAPPHLQQCIDDAFASSGAPKSKQPKTDVRELVRALNRDTHHETR